uniref:Uncharacterized protein n=1 Tax=Kalanchoe fedtschenkoi TaxID=63787 RepID=A0A7N0T761_KALFE
MGTISFLTLLLFVFICFVSAARPSHGGRRAPVNYEIPAPGEKIFNILDYGVQPNTKKVYQMQIRWAFLAACRTPGRTRVVIPPGRYIVDSLLFAGPCNSSLLIFQISGDLVATTDLSNMGDGYWILFERIKGLVVVGARGSIDGQGGVPMATESRSIWQANDCKTNDNCVFPPASLKFHYVNNVIVRNIKSINPKAFHFHVNNCRNIRFQKVHLIAPDDSPNTDGIHTSNSSYVKITQSLMQTGDDCISLGHGSSNIFISDVVCGPGHGFSIGSLGERANEFPVTNVFIRRNKLIRTDNGVRIKTFPKPNKNHVSNVVFDDITMTDVKNPIIIDQEYHNPQSATSSHVKLRDIQISNVRGTTISPVAVRVICSKLFPCDNLKLSNINLKYTGTKAVGFTSSCLNAKPVYSGIQVPPPCN